MVWTQEEKAETLRLRGEGHPWEGIAAYWRAKGKDATAEAVRCSVKKREAIIVPEIPSGELPIEEILEQKERLFDAIKRRDDATRLIKIKVNSTLPIGIVHFGDPHLDDDGTDIGKLRRDIRLVSETDGMYAASAGDMTNNWVGRLARLYANQESSERTALRLVEWFIESLDWLYIIGGNHDVWSGQKDPLVWLARQAGTIYEWHGVRIGLEFPNGAECRINARHDFKGSSQWNILHAALKASKLGSRDDIFVCGHRHSSGYMTCQVDRKPVHCIMVAGYKRYDDYAKQNDFQGAEYMESAVTIIDPEAGEYNKVRVFTDVPEGCDYLTYIRSKRQDDKHNQ